MIQYNSHIWQNEYELVETFSEKYGIYIVRKKNQIGVIRISGDNSLEITVPIEYDEISVLYKNTYLLLAKVSGKKRIIKVSPPKTVLSDLYDKVGPYLSYLGLIPVSNNYLVGALNKDLKEIIPVQYDILDNCAFNIVEVGSTHRFVLFMKKEGLWGVYNTSGDILLPFEYEEINDSIYYYTESSNSQKRCLFSDRKILGTGLVPVKKNEKWGLVKELSFREVVPCIYKSIRSCSTNKIELEKDIGHDILLLTREGPLMEHFSNGKLEKYTKIGRFNYGFAPVQKNGKYGVVDKAYNEVIPCIYDEVSSFKDGLATVKRNRKYGYINEKGKLITPCIYDEVSEFINSFAIVKKDGKYGYIGIRGNEITSCVFDEISPFLHGLSIVRIGEQYGAINERGRMVIPLEYQALADFSYTGPTMLMAIKEKLFGVVDANNKVIVPFEYDGVNTFDGMITVTRHKKKGVFNHKGQQIVSVEYDDIKHPFSTSTSINVCKKGKWGVLNKIGQEICPTQYDAIDDCGFSCGRLAVCRDGKWGFINRKGEEVIDCIYDKVYQFFEENHCDVELNGEKITIDTYGNQIRKR